MIRVKVPWTINSEGGGFYIYDIIFLIIVEVGHYVAVLTSLVSLNLLVPSRTVTSLLIRQVVVSLLGCLRLWRRRLLGRLIRILTGPGCSLAPSLSLAMIGALCKVIVYMIWSQCPVSGSLPLPIGPDTAQPAYNSSPLPRHGPPSPAVATPESGADKGNFSALPQCDQLLSEPATGELVSRQFEPNPTWGLGPGPREMAEQPAYSSVNCQTWSCQVIRRILLMFLIVPILTLVIQSLSKSTKEENSFV